jgi:hypothetical protein
MPYSKPVPGYPPPQNNATIEKIVAALNQHARLPGFLALLVGGRNKTYDR